MEYYEVLVEEYTGECRVVVFYDAQQCFEFCCEIADVKRLEVNGKPFIAVDWY